MTTAHARTETPGDETTHTESVFGRVQLSYLVVESARMGAWHRFGADAIGLHVDELHDGSLRFRLDEHTCRFLVQRPVRSGGRAQAHAREDVTAIGWHAGDHDVFDTVLRRVSDRGVPIAEGTAEEAAKRGVERLWRFPGPKGIAQELFTTPVTTTAPLRMVSSGFVTGGGGMGHVAITSREPQAIHRYYDTVLDSRVSDYIDENIAGLTLKIRFLRVNERHHSIAVANIDRVKIQPIRTSVQHVNIQAATLEDVMSAYSRVRALGFSMAWSIGQHTNDKELSFYCVTPSGFELEVGWNPIVLTPELEAAWRVATHQGISTWGHKPVDPGITDKLEQLRQAALHLARPEITVPELSA